MRIPVRQLKLTFDQSQVTEKREIDFEKLLVLDSFKNPICNPF